MGRWDRANDKTLTPATTTVSGTKYNENVKFYARGASTGNGTTEKQATVGNPYSVILDKYDNIIGLVQPTSNFLVIEAIEWQDQPGVIGGGYALANVVPANGAEVPNVTVSTIDGRAITESSTPAITNRSVSEAVDNNNAYYDHLWTYSVNPDGTYALGNCCHDDGTHTAGLDNTSDNTAYDATATQLGAGSTVLGATRMNGNTVFLVKDNPNSRVSTYTPYVGKESIPSMKNVQACWVEGTDGYAAIVVISGYTTADSSFVAYVNQAAALTAGGTIRINNTPYYGYEVFDVNAGKTRTVYNSGQNYFGGVNGLFYVTVDDNNILGTGSDLREVIYKDSDTDSSNRNSGKDPDHSWAGYGNSVTLTSAIGGTLKLSNGASYNITNATIYALKTYYKADGTTVDYVDYDVITEAQFDSGDYGTLIRVGYNVKGGNNVAEYVIVIDDDGPATIPTINPGGADNGGKHANTNSAGLSLANVYADLGITFGGSGKSITIDIPRSTIVAGLRGAGGEDSAYWKNLLNMLRTPGFSGETMTDGALIVGVYLGGILKSEIKSATTNGNNFSAFEENSDHEAFLYLKIGTLTGVDGGDTTNAIYSIDSEGREVELVITDTDNGTHTFNITITVDGV